jgi:carboxyvinyl-carboxyphosphonate phosphorylmutase
MLGGSVASLVVLGDPDIALITLTELAEQMRRMSRAASLPVLVDADHGYGNAMNVRRTVQELESAGAAGLTIEDTLLPQAYGEAKTQLVSLEEGVGKIKAALDGRSDPRLVIMGRTAVGTSSRRDWRPGPSGVSMRCSSRVRRGTNCFIVAATTLPIVLGGPRTCQSRTACSQWCRAAGSRAVRRRHLAGWKRLRCVREPSRL